MGEYMRVYVYVFMRYCVCKRVHIRTYSHTCVNIDPDAHLFTIETTTACKYSEIFKLYSDIFIKNATLHTGFPDFPDLAAELGSSKPGHCLVKLKIGFWIQGD